ncbi:mechanosensitive ion channel [Rheinheimera riviphila]|uniref:Mechanosensitive ion channel n=1 Tax=Rheinheimera riviphila TaxID=1834037 RepID=A0A437R2A8_9GAMM|nr:mechanosensitive ion channel domain-containing protein [Rheinheimera riviphila]RVU40888.1 mechanosensitive ion channel [Rheinheimera riviphila]
MTKQLQQYWQQGLTLIAQPHFLIQLSLIAASLVLAWLFNSFIQTKLALHNPTGFKHVALRSSQRIMMPLSLALLFWLCSAVLEANEIPAKLLDLLLPVALALGVVRLLVYILRKAFSSSPLIKSAEPFVVITIWLTLVLHLLGWLTPLLKLFDALAVTFGESRISLLIVIKLVLIIVLAFTIALWLAEVINQKMKNSKVISPSMQVGFSKFAKFFLITSAFLFALNAVGINLSSLAIFGGALGVGLGFGLQRIASNFISGFILVFDRSIKPGDIITVGDKFGWVEQLNARYVVLRNRQGVDTLIPNENLIITEVINWSYADPNVRLEVKIPISYHNDPEQAMALMLQCANASPRVLTTPEPTVRLMDFAESGMNLQLRVWIADMENGTASVKSEINLAIWRAFKANNITMPFPQRDLHLKSGWPALEKPATPEMPEKPAPTQDD